MISKDTKPGTQVVCIDDANGKWGPVALKKGDIYTIKEIIPDTETLSKTFCALVEEIAPEVVWSKSPAGYVHLGYGLDRFNYLGWERFQGLLKGKAPPPKKKMQKDVERLLEKALKGER